MQILFDDTLLRTTTPEQRGQMAAEFEALYRDQAWTRLRCDEHGERIALRLSRMEANGQQWTNERLEGCCLEFEVEVGRDRDGNFDEGRAFWDDHEGASLEWWKWQIKHDGLAVNPDWFQTVPGHVLGQWARSQATVRQMRRLVELLIEHLVDRPWKSTQDFARALRDYGNGELPPAKFAVLWSQFEERLISETALEGQSVHWDVQQYLSSEGMSYERQIAWSVRAICFGDPAFARAVHDAVGPPLPQPHSPVAWRTPAVAQVARSMVEKRQFDLMPMLGDLLEEAGAPEDVVRHCRDEGPHTHACWVLDWILGRNLNRYPTKAMTIYFYTTTDQYGAFSNFSRHGFELDGQYWLTAEHFFQAQKFAGTEYADHIARAMTPKEAASRGRSRKHPLREDWEQVKDDIMRRAVRRKFETHAELREMLLATSEEEIVESAPGDYYWGCGADGSGQNKLGKILMEVRGELRNRGG